MKTSRIFLFIILISLFSILFAVACDDDDDDDDDDDNNTTDDDDDDDNSTDDDDGDDDDNSTDDDDDSQTWTDQNSGLMWQNGDEFGKNRAEAAEYCQSRTFGGHDDWRLPTISELRSLIRGCAAVATGGSCGVTDDCLSHDNCWDASCEGCADHGGPGPDGRYWPSDLSGQGCCYWTTSDIPDMNGKAWLLNFENGYIYELDTDFGDNEVRCVRETGDG